VFLDEVPDDLSADLAQADVRPADPGQRPLGAPAVAVEHRQRPQIDAVLVEGRVDDLSEAVQVGAAVGVDHTLGFAGGAGGVVDRDRCQLILDRPLEGVGGPS